MKIAAAAILVLILSIPVFPQESSISKSTDVVTLGECITIAQKNYKPLRLADEEIKLSNLKLTESTRGMYPNIIGKAEETRGAAVEDTGTPNFKEQSYGVQVTYPLFQSGRLWFTRKQAVSNCLISQLKYDKARQEMVYSVNEAYWNVVRTRTNLEEYKKALADVKKYYDISRQLFDSGTLNERELVSVESQYNQARYQVQTTEADLENYSWKLAEALGISKPVERPIKENMPFKDIMINMNECLKFAEKSNPDIVIQDEAAKVSRYGLKVKKNYKWPKIDLNGFYGRSGGAFESEELKLTEDYQVGVQVSQTFFMNTLSASGLRQRTSPKLGQSSRTESDNASASLSFLDAFKQKAEEKEADVLYKQSVYTQEKTRNSVASEVREAYFNYKKALSQVRNAEIEVDLAKKGLAIDEINLGNDRTSIVNIVESRNKYAGALASLNEAKSFYLISLSALNKAIGIEGLYKLEDIK